MKPEILLVDDDKNSLKGLKTILEQDGYKVTGASNGYEALRQLDEHAFDILVTDIKMPGIDGFTLLEEARKRDDDIRIILITAYSSVQSAVEAMRKGVEDYLTKPVNVEELEAVIDKTWEKQKLLIQNRELKRRLKERYKFSEIIGNGVEMQRIYKTISSVAPSTASILLLGETGTGKELAAKAIHHNSLRADGPFIVLNCSALSEGVLESELFGHERGAFTGAIREKRGRFELANEGTLFLDEVGEMPLTVQVKLLRVLEQNEFERVGGEKTLKVDVRFIAATNKDIDEEIKKGNFREDLYYRLNVITLKIPPLRERREDIPLLADYFLIKYSRENLKEIKGFSQEAMTLLQQYHWPGNVRELENVIERAVVLCQEEVIQPSHLPSHSKPQIKRNGSTISIPVGIAQREAEKEVILNTLKITGGNKTKAASILGISTRKIEYKLKEWGMA